MSQANIIAASIFFAFIVYITMRSRLGKYLNVLFGSSGGGEQKQSDNGMPKMPFPIPGLGG